MIFSFHNQHLSRLALNPVFVEVFSHLRAINGLVLNINILDVAKTDSYKEINLLPAQNNDPVDFFEKSINYTEHQHSNFTNFSYIGFTVKPILFLRSASHIFRTSYDDSPDVLVTPSSENNNQSSIFFALHTRILNDFWYRFKQERTISHSFETTFDRVCKLYKVKNFEKGEIAITRYPEVNWKEISNAAIVCAEAWPEKECAEFMQSLFFGRYLGDETGMFMNILHP